MNDKVIEEVNKETILRDACDMLFWRVGAIKFEPHDSIVLFGERFIHKNFRKTLLEILDLLRRQRTHQWSSPGTVIEHLQYPRFAFEACAYANSRRHSNLPLYNTAVVICNVLFPCENSHGQAYAASWKPDRNVRCWENAHEFTIRLATQEWGWTGYLKEANPLLERGHMCRHEHD